MTYARSTHLAEVAEFVDFGRAQTAQTTLTYTTVVPVVQTQREIIAGGFALILTTPFLHIDEVWINCVAADGGYIFADYESLAAGVGVFQDTAIYVGQTLILTDVLTPTELAFPFFIVTVPGVNDTAKFVYQIFGTSIL